VGGRRSRGSPNARPLPRLSIPVPWPPIPKRPSARPMAPASSTPLRGHRPLQLRLAHARAAADPKPLRLVVELLLGLALRTVRARATASSPRWRRAPGRAPGAGPRCAGSSAILLHRPGCHLLRPAGGRAAPASAALDLPVLTGSLGALPNPARWHCSSFVSASALPRGATRSPTGQTGGRAVPPGGVWALRGMGS
jgi:hypothetical protein